MKRIFSVSPFVFLAMWFVHLSSAVGAEPPARQSLWIDVYRGEPLSYDELLDDLAGVQVVYLGEYHTIRKHHELQQRVVTDLAQRGKPMVLAMEQLESFQQPAIDRYNRGEITFDQLAKETDWPHRWSGYEMYRPIVEAAHKAGMPILALNARAETIRQVARGGGIDRLDPKTRSALPKDIQLDDPLYTKLLNLQMMVHMAANPQSLRPMIEAQIARDESMAAALAAFLGSKAGQGRSAVVLCGAGHVAYGLGTPARVRRRLPQAKDRIVLLSESGDVVLSAHEKAAARPITITHEQLRQIDRPIADYLNETSLKEEPAKR